MKPLFWSMSKAVLYLHNHLHFNCYCLYNPFYYKILASVAIFPMQIS